MKTLTRPPHPGITKVLRNLTVVIAASFLAGLVASWARPTQVPPTKIMPAAQSAEEARLVEDLADFHGSDSPAKEGGL